MTSTPMIKAKSEPCMLKSEAIQSTQNNVMFKSDAEQSRHSKTGDGEGGPCTMLNYIVFVTLNVQNTKIGQAINQSSNQSQATNPSVNQSINHKQPMTRCAPIGCSFHSYHRELYEEVANKPYYYDVIDTLFKPSRLRTRYGQV